MYIKKKRKRKQLIIKKKNNLGRKTEINKQIKQYYIINKNKNKNAQIEVKNLIPLKLSE